MELAFDEGATIAKDGVLKASMTVLSPANQDRSRQLLGVASAQVAVYESSLAAAQSNVSSDGFDLVEKQRDYARAESLVKTNAISIQGRDLAIRPAAAQSAAQNWRVRRPWKQVAYHQCYARAKPNGAAVGSKLALDEVTLGYATLKAPFAGVLVSVREAELGQLAVWSGDLHRRSRSRLVARLCERAGSWENPAQ